MTTDGTININGNDIATVLRETMDENANLKIQIAALKRTILELQSQESDNATREGDLRKTGGKTTKEKEKATA
jgi:regulator of replication initiation timing|tara:strand:+ start:461 stop:679 length:219 start_codon:yes stop_codon:yes gene_type:complete